MDKLRSFFVLFLVIVLVIAAAHSVYYLGGFDGLGISGSVVDDSEVDGIVSFSPRSSLSRVILFIEWEAIVLLFIFVLLRRKNLTKKELQELTFLKQNIKNEGLTTDIDNLNQLLKKKGRARLSTVAKLYNINKDIAMGWGKTLEAAHLAVIEYPRFSEPEFVFIGNSIEENVKSKK